MGPVLIVINYIINERVNVSQVEVDGTALFHVVLCVLKYREKWGSGGKLFL